MTIGEFLKGARRRRNEALWLLSSLVGKNQSELFLLENQPLSASQLRKLKGWSARAKRGEPLQYITGEAPFWGRNFSVAPGVLIPRPETEVLVELALRVGDELKDAPFVFDVGAGSGCILQTLLLERPTWRGAASEPDPKALKQAHKNALRFGIEASFFSAPFLNAVIVGDCPKPTIVVSNPPYLSRAEKVSPQVKKWEPKDALFSPEGGAWHAEQIFLQCLHILPRFLILELSARVAARLEKRWQQHTQVLRIWREADLTGRKRFLLLEFVHG